MKKLSALLLTAVMALSLAACGGNAENSSADDSNADNNTMITDQDSDNSFDTGWASNEYEALLPELPFTGWTTKQDGNTYKMEILGLNTETFTDADGKTIGYGEDKAALIDYLGSLATYGFTVEETGGIEGYMYKWEIKDAAGNEIEITCAEGACWVEIVKK